MTTLLCLVILVINVNFVTCGGIDRGDSGHHYDGSEGGNSHSHGEQTASSSGHSGVKTLFGLGLGYQKMVWYKPVLVLQKPKIALLDHSKTKVIHGPPPHGHYSSQPQQTPNLAHFHGAGKGFGGGGVNYKSFGHGGGGAGHRGHGGGVYATPLNNVIKYQQNSNTQYGPGGGGGHYHGGSDKGQHYADYTYDTDADAYEAEDDHGHDNHNHHHDADVHGVHDSSYHSEQGHGVNVKEHHNQVKHSPVTGKNHNDHGRNGDNGHTDNSHIDNGHTHHQKHADASHGVGVSPKQVDHQHFDGHNHNNQVTSHVENTGVGQYLEAAGLGQYNNNQAVHHAPLENSGDVGQYVDSAHDLMEHRQFPNNLGLYDTPTQLPAPLQYHTQLAGVGHQGYGSRHSQRVLKVNRFLAGQRQRQRQIRFPVQTQPKLRLRSKSRRPLIRSNSKSRIPGTKNVYGHRRLKKVKPLGKVEQGKILHDFQRLVQSHEWDDDESEHPSKNNSHHEEDDEEEELDSNSNSDNAYMKSSNQWNETPWKGLGSSPLTPVDDKKDTTKKHPSSISDILDSSSSSKQQNKV